MTIPQHAIDAQIQTAIETKMRHGYTSTAVVIARKPRSRNPHLSFYFSDCPPAIGSVVTFDYDDRVTVLALA